MIDAAAKYCKLTMKFLSVDLLLTSVTVWRPEIHNGFYLAYLSI